MITEFNNYSEMSEYTASIVLEMIEENPELNIGLPTGSTPIGMYRNLIMGQGDWSKVKTFNLDEYEGVGHSHPESYHMYMTKNFFLHVNINQENVHFPNNEYDETIENLGGLDLVILGIGHNGHIAFNEPGSSITSRTRKVKLSKETIEANSRFFKDSGEVPRSAFTIGMKTIRESKRIILIANGPDKLDILDECFNGDINKDRPASILQVHPKIEVFYAPE